MQEGTSEWWSFLVKVATLPETWYILLFVIFFVILILKSESDKEDTTLGIIRMAEGLKETFRQEQATLKHEMEQIQSVQEAQLEVLSEMREEREDAEGGTDSFYEEERALEAEARKRAAQELADERKAIADEKRKNEIRNREEQVRTREVRQSLREKYGKGF